MVLGGFLGFSSALCEGDLAFLSLGLQVGDGGDLDRFVWEGDGGALAVLEVNLIDFACFCEEEVFVDLCNFLWHKFIEI